MRYTKKVKYRHVIGTPATCGYQHFFEKSGFNDRAIFAQSYFVLPVLHNILHHYSQWMFYHFTFSSLSAWGKSYGTCEAKAKEKHQKKRKVTFINKI